MPIEGMPAPPNKVEYQQALQHVKAARQSAGQGLGNVTDRVGALKKHINELKVEERQLQTDERKISAYLKKNPLSAFLNFFASLRGKGVQQQVVVAQKNVHEALLKFQEERVKAEDPVNTYNELDKKLRGMGAMPKDIHNLTHEQRVQALDRFERISPALKLMEEQDVLTLMNLLTQTEEPTEAQIKSFEEVIILKMEIKRVAKDEKNEIRLLNAVDRFGTNFAQLITKMKSLEKESLSFDSDYEANLAVQKMDAEPERELNDFLKKHGYLS